MRAERAVGEIVGVLLAAGVGRRFGGDKQLHPLPDGTPMAVAAAQNLMPACTRVIAMVRPDHPQLEQLLELAGCEIVRAESQKGMGHTLSAGVAATRNAEGWIVALADMPFIASSTHETLADCLREGASLVAAEYNGQRGHPVGFSRVWRDELLGLSGDRGGRAILENHREQVVLCPVDDWGVLADIDYQYDLDNFIKRL